MTAGMQTDLSDDTILATVLTSPKAIRALEAAGLKTVGDVRNKALKELSSIKGVGDAALDALRALGVKEEGAPSGSVEETIHPIELRSQFLGYRIRLLKGTAVFNGPSVQIIPPVFVQFDKGEGRLTRKDWLMAKHERNEKVVNEELKKPVEQAPWRAEACEWLKGRNAYKRHDFVILFD